MDLSHLSDSELQDLALKLKQKEEIERYNKIELFFTDDGPNKRASYQKHIAFMNAGKECNQRALIAANRTGKSFVACYELVRHLTGLYPEWWKGRVFKKPIKAWICAEKTAIAEMAQEYLLGSIDFPGTGLIPRDCIENPKRDITRKEGVKGIVREIKVKHFTDGKFDGYSRVSLKTYDESIGSFKAATLDLVLMDEEPHDYTFYTECLTRIMNTSGGENGLIMATFTPQHGLSQVVLSFLPDGVFPEGGMGIINGKFIVNVDWDDVPHLTEESKKEMLASYLPWERDARARGVPSIGAGRVFPIDESRIVIEEPFKIPDHWPRAYGLDFGGGKVNTAAIWAAKDPNTDIWYLYDEFYRCSDGLEPVVVAEAIKSRGKHLYGAADPAGRSGESSKGESHLKYYRRKYGLKLIKANKTNKEANILKVWDLLISGKLKVFPSLSNFLKEFRVYRRDEKGNIQGTDDLMDALQYLVVTGMKRAMTKSQAKIDTDYIRSLDDRSSITGY